MTLRATLQGALGSRPQAARAGVRLARAHGRPRRCGRPPRPPRRRWPRRASSICTRSGSGAGPYSLQALRARNSTGKISTQTGQKAPCAPDAAQIRQDVAAGHYDNDQTRTFWIITGTGTEAGLIRLLDLAEDRKSVV